jgi:hypothetical protein
MAANHAMFILAGIIVLVICIISFIYWKNKPWWGYLVLSILSITSLFGIYLASYYWIEEKKFNSDWTRMKMQSGKAIERLPAMIQELRQQKDWSITNYLETIDQVRQILPDRYIPTWEQLENKVFEARTADAQRRAMLSYLKELYDLVTNKKLKRT